MKILEHIEAELQKQSVTLALYGVRHDNRTPVEEITVPLRDNVEFTLGNARFCVRLFATPADFSGTLLDINFKILSGSVDNASLGVCAEFVKWSRDEWVFMPACVYAGNRFRRVTPEDMQNPAPDPESWVTLTRDLGLNPGDGPSWIQVLAGDCATPCAGILSPSAQRGLLLLSTQGSGYGDLGIHVEENETRSHARLLFKSPGVREGAKYNVANSRFSDADAGACFSGGDSLTLPLLVHAFPATAPEALYKHFVRLRKTFGPHRERHDLPFETAFRLIEEKHNRENWVESYGYWSVGMRESLPQDWQSGWVGGPNTMWPLFLRGDAYSTGRALRVWDFVAEHAVTPSGFLKGSFTKGDWGNAPERCYMRYSADTLYFLMKTLLHLRVGPPHIEPKETWLSLARGLCKAFTGCWEESGHLPHYADARTGHVIVGGSCAAALAPAGLALAARYFDEPGYRTVAESAARRYRDNFLARGITNGGPGDIRQNVDSESAAALLESFIILMEESDGAPEWVDAAVRAAAYCATWVTSYDFRFPPASTFGRLDMLTTGTVWANVQNKHAAPGICTLSGSSLLKLWRVTGDAVWLDLLRDIARCLPQYVSRADRPIPDVRTGKRWSVMPPGWVNERVNLSDWEVRGEPWEEIGVGEIFGGSCWSEPAVLNTIAEVPGIILNLDTCELAVLDHVHAQVFRVAPEIITLRLTNSTAFPAAPVLLAETSAERTTRWLGSNPLAGLPKLHLPPFTTLDYPVQRKSAVRMKME